MCATSEASGSPGLLARGGKNDFGFLGMPAVKEGRVTDGMHQFAAEFSRDTLDHRPAFSAIGRVEADLEQLMVAERIVCFGQYRFGQPGLTHHDNRFQVVTQLPQMPFLMFRQRHV